MDREILASVIIPSHGRRDSLRRALDALKTQTFPLNSFEVIVVVDGDIDDTTGMMREYKAPYPLVVIEQENQGSSRSRNNAVARARGRILVFQDNDLEATPPFIEEHIKAHGENTDCVAIGYAHPVIPDGSDFFHTEHRMWWLDFYYRKRRPGYLFHFRDLAGCNFSISKALFDQVGGFDAEITDFCHEDIELGIRLLKTGARFIFAPEAFGYHHVLVSLKQNFKRRREEGKVEIRIARRHPEIWTLLPPGADQSQSFMSTMMRQFAFTHPAIGDRIATLLQWSLIIFEKMRYYRRWRRHLDGLHHYWNWRGAAEELGSEQALLELEKTIKNHPENYKKLEINLGNGLENALHQIDVERPAAMIIYYRSHYIGSIPYHPGAQLMRGENLYPYLANNFARPMLKALALENVIDRSETHDPFLDRFLVHFNITEAEKPVE